MNGPEPLAPAYASTSGDDVGTNFVRIGVLSPASQVTNLQPITAVESFVTILCGQWIDLIANCVWLRGRRALFVETKARSVQPLLVAAAATAPRLPLEVWSRTTVKMCACRGNTHTFNAFHRDPPGKSSTPAGDK